MSVWQRLAESGDAFPRWMLDRCREEMPEVFREFKVAESAGEEDREQLRQRMGEALLALPAQAYLLKHALYRAMQGKMMRAVRGQMDTIQEQREEGKQALLDEENKYLSQEGVTERLGTETLIQVLFLLLDESSIADDAVLVLIRSEFKQLADDLESHTPLDTPFYYDGALQALGVVAKCILEAPCCSKETKIDVLNQWARIPVATGVLSHVIRFCAVLLQCQGSKGLQQCTAAVLERFLNAVGGHHTSASNGGGNMCEWVPIQSVVDSILEVVATRTKEESDSSKGMFLPFAREWRPELFDAALEFLDVNASQNGSNDTTAASKAVLRIVITHIKTRPGNAMKRLQAHVRTRLFESLQSRTNNAELNLDCCIEFFIPSMHDRIKYVEMHWDTLTDSVFQYLNRQEVLLDFVQHADVQGDSSENEHVMALLKRLVNRAVFEHQDGIVLQMIQNVMNIALALGLFSLLDDLLKLVLDSVHTASQEKKAPNLMACAGRVLEPLFYALDPIRSSSHVDFVSLHSFAAMAVNASQVCRDGVLEHAVLDNTEVVVTVDEPGVTISQIDFPGAAKMEIDVSQLVDARFDTVQFFQGPDQSMPVTREMEVQSLEWPQYVALQGPTATILTRCKHIESDVDTLHALPVKVSYPDDPAGPLHRSALAAAHWIGHYMAERNHSGTAIANEANADQNDAVESSGTTLCLSRVSPSLWTDADVAYNILHPVLSSPNCTDSVRHEVAQLLLHHDSLLCSDDVFALLLTVVGTSAQPITFLAHYPELQDYLVPQDKRGLAYWKAYRELLQILSYEASFTDRILDFIGPSIAFLERQRLLHHDEKDDALVCVLEYEHDFDERGLFYYVGTHGYTQPWLNPALSHRVRVLASSMQDDSIDASAFVGRTTERCLTRALPFQSILVDIRPYELRPSAYTLKHYSSYDTEALRNWVLEASTDGNAWTALRIHVNDESLSTAGETQTWTLQATQAFSQFRIRMTGMNSNGSWHLACSGFELYGALYSCSSAPSLASPSSTGRYQSAPDYWSVFDTSMIRFLDDDTAPLQVENNASGNTWQVVHTQNTYTSGKHRHEMMVEASGDTSNTWKIVIGLVPSSFKTTAQTSKCVGGSQGGWGYVAATGHKYHDSLSQAYGEPFTAGDCIAIEMDFDQKTVEFFKNGVSQGVAFDDLEGPAHLAVSFTGHQTRIVLQTASHGQSAQQLAGSSVPSGPLSREEWKSMHQMLSFETIPHCIPHVLTLVPEAKVVQLNDWNEQHECMFAFYLSFLLAAPGPPGSLVGHICGVLQRIRSETVRSYALFALKQLLLRSRLSDVEAVDLFEILENDVQVCSDQHRGLVCQVAQQLIAQYSVLLQIVESALAQADPLDGTTSTLLYLATGGCFQHTCAGMTVRLEDQTGVVRGHRSGDILSIKLDDGTWVEASCADVRPAPRMEYGSAIMEDEALWNRYCDTILFVKGYRDIDLDRLGALQLLVVEFVRLFAPFHVVASRFAQLVRQSRHTEADHDAAVRQLLQSRPAHMTLGSTPAYIQTLTTCKVEWRGCDVRAKLASGGDPLSLDVGATMEIYDDGSDMMITGLTLVCSVDASPFHMEAYHPDTQEWIPMQQHVSGKSTVASSMSMYVARIRVRAVEPCTLVYLDVDGFSFSPDPSAEDPSPSPSAALGYAYAFGKGDSGRLGSGSPSSLEAPQRLVGLDEQVQQVCSFGSHVVLLTVSGRVMTFGNGDHGRLGHGSRAQHRAAKVVETLASVPIVAIACGNAFCMALSAQGRLWMWGQGSNGQIGDGMATDRLVPVELPQSSFDGEIVQGIGCGGYHAFAITLRSLFAWGKNQYGQLGVNSTTMHKTPYRVPLPTGVRIKAVVGGWDHTLALSEEGHVYSWGGGYELRRPVCGHGSNDRVLAPKRIETLQEETVVKIRAGWDHSLALTAGGSLFIWGGNNNGALGNGHASIHQFVPVKVPLPDPVLDMDAGQDHTVCISSKGHVWTWGSCGPHLGYSGHTPQLEPKNVDSNTLFQSVACGQKCNILIDTAAALPRLPGSCAMTPMYCPFPAQLYTPDCPVDRVQLERSTPFTLSIAICADEEILKQELLHVAAGDFSIAVAVENGVVKGTLSGSQEPIVSIDGPMVLLSLVREVATVRVYHGTDLLLTTHTTEACTAMVLDGSQPFCSHAAVWEFALDATALQRLSLSGLSHVSAYHLDTAPHMFASMGYAPSHLKVALAAGQSYAHPASLCAWIHEHAAELKQRDEEARQRQHVEALARVLDIDKENAFHVLNDSGFDLGVAVRSLVYSADTLARFPTFETADPAVTVECGLRDRLIATMVLERSDIGKTRWIHVVPCAVFLDWVSLFDADELKSRVLPFLAPLFASAAAAPYRFETVADMLYHCILRDPPRASLLPLVRLAVECEPQE